MGFQKKKREKLLQLLADASQVGNHHIITHLKVAYTVPQRNAQLDEGVVITRAIPGMQRPVVLLVLSKTWPGAETLVIILCSKLT